MIFVLVVLSGAAGYLAAQQRNAGIRSTDLASADLEAQIISKPTTPPAEPQKESAK